MVMEELGIMKFNNGIIEINEGVKANLSASPIYNFVCKLLKIK